MRQPQDQPRFYVPDLPEAGEVRLPPAEAHHAAHVLRVRPGAAAELFDGRGRAARARILAVRRGEVVAAVEAAGGPAAQPQPRVRLAFAVPKGSRLDWLLEKATELGVAALAPVRFERSIAGWGEFSEAKRGRWLGRCIAAAKQARLDWLPEIEAPLPLADFLAAAGAHPGVFGDLGADALPIARAVMQLLHAGCHAFAPLRKHGHRQPESVLSQAKAWHPATAPPPVGLTVLIGPEGGLTDVERAAARSAGLLPVHLGRTTLRIETAAVALVAAVIAESQGEC